MITRFSWRRPDCTPVDAGSGTKGASAEHLLATDAGATTVLHLDPGGQTPTERSASGQLLLVVAGAGTVEIDGETAEVRVGDAVRWPARVPHRLTTSEGISVVVVSHPEEAGAWRVTRRNETGRRWVAGVFADTDRARAFRDRLRELVSDAVSLD